MTEMIFNFSVGFANTTLDGNSSIFIGLPMYYNDESYLTCTINGTKVYCYYIKPKMIRIKSFETVL